MLGIYALLLWFFVFFRICYLLIRYFKINSILLRTIFIWTFFNFFVSIWEFMLLFYYKYVEKKGNYYYENNKCYWTSDVSISDAFSYKMYMDIYADYSYCDKRYIKNLIKNEGNRFVLSAEIIHGIFAAIFSIIILTLFFTNSHKIYIYLSSIIFSSIQFGLIIWYLTTLFMERIFVKNEKEWLPPILWNVPWVLIPIYIIYYSCKIIIPSIIRKKN